MTERRETVSVLILAKNEAARIGRCLERTQWADEVLVVDDMSTDQTAEICRQHGARVVQRVFDNFSDQANFGLAHVMGSWVLSLDADELVTPRLREQIQRAVTQASDCVGFTFKRLNYFLGHCMYYGGWHHDVLHLFRRDAGRFAGKVHHTPQLVGTIRHLDADVEHYPFQSLCQFVNRQNRYTSMEAQEIFEQFGDRLRIKVDQEIRVRPLKLAWKFYVKKQGFREGMHGLVFSVLFAWVHFLKWAKYWELAHSRPCHM